METKNAAVTQNLDVAHDILQRALADPDAFPDNVVVIPLHLLASGEAGLTPARLEMLVCLREQGSFARLQDLADALGRGKHRVSKDVNALAALGLVHKERRGRATSLRAEDRPILLA